MSEQIWSTKQCRTYHRVKSGLAVAARFGESVRFITLTSAPGVHRMCEDWSMLTKRIRRKFGRFEYIRVRTNEGNGVIHVLYRGAYIPQRWLCKNWNDIHSSPIVDIRLVRPFKGLASYIVAQYVSDQKSSYQRSSSSWNWIYYGWSHTWDSLRIGILEKIPRKEAWYSHLKGFKVKIFDRGVHRFLSPYPMLNTMRTEQTLITNGLFLSETPIFYERLLSHCAWLNE